MTTEHDGGPAWDPDTLLARIRALLDTDSGHGMHTLECMEVEGDCADPGSCEGDAQADLADAFNILDAGLRRGAFLPTDWLQYTTGNKRCRRCRPQARATAPQTEKEAGK